MEIYVPIETLSEDWYRYHGVNREQATNEVVEVIDSAWDAFERKQLFTVWIQRYKATQFCERSCLELYMQCLRDIREANKRLLD